MKKFGLAIILILVFCAILCACQDSTCTLSVSVKDDLGGTVSRGGAFLADSEVQVVATPEDGYVFDGWYDENGSKLSDERSYSFSMPDSDLSLTAVFTLCTQHELDGCTCTVCNLTAHDLDNNCYCSRCNKTVHTLDEDCHCEVCNKAVHSLDDNGCICSVCQKPVHTPDGNCVCSSCGSTAHRSGNNCICTVCGEEAHNLDGNCVCKTCGNAFHGYKNGSYCIHRDDDLCYIGQYPQTEVTDEALSASLNDAAGALPSTSDLGAWAIIDNYYSGETTDCAYYTDVELDGEKYRGVYFTSYRSHYVGESIADNQTFQYRNGYRVDTVYWFKYEPIGWRIFEENKGKAKLVCSIALDCMQFSNSLAPVADDGKTPLSPSDYRYSTVREWLNENFLEDAFSDSSRTKILLSISPSGAYVESGATDYVSILSRNEMTAIKYGYKDSPADEDEMRIKACSDYARCMGIWQNDDGYCSYWLRNAFVTHDDYLYCSYVDGKISNTRRADDSGTGVAPTILISLG